VTQPKLNRCTRPRYIFFLFAFLCIVQVKAQETIETTQAKLLSRFSFQLLTGGVIIVHATIDNHPDTLNFILDTGSGGISLDSVTAEELSLVRTPSDKVIRGIGGIKTVEFAKDHSLNLPGLSVKNLDFHVIDYSLLTSVYGQKVAGIIGFSFLRRYIVAINYDENKISVFSPGKYKYPNRGHFLNPSFGSIPVQRVLVKDGKSIINNFYFDTGAGLCMLLSDSFANDSTVLKKNKILIATQAEGMGGKRPMQITVIDQVKLGPYKFKKVPTYIFKDDFNATSYPSTGGLIGNDLLRRFNVVLNYPAQLIHICPNKSFSNGFDYSYTGLGIYKENDEIIVEDVIAGSPGEKAGFLPGDKIIAVENDFTKNIQAYRAVLQEAESKVKIIVLRGNEAKELTIKVRNILHKK
jgi:membrane-associated protease RseP (regulator of RpoE activity)